MTIETRREIQRAQRRLDAVHHYAEPNPLDSWEAAERWAPARPIRGGA